jgi:hypothetical protein
VLAGHLPESHYHLGVDQVDLALEVLPAVAELLVGRVPVVRRPAAHAVGDADRLAVQPDLQEHLVEQRAAAPDERLAVLVLLCAGPLADEQDVGVGRAGAVHDSRPGLDERRAAIAGRHLEAVHLAVHARRLWGSSPQSTGRCRRTPSPPVGAAGTFLMRTDDCCP